MPRPGPRPYECVRRAWHSDRHQPIRGSLIQEIFRVANEVHNPITRKNKEWQEKLPFVVLKAEEIMYSKANSEAEYMDPNTLWDRANDAIDTIIRKDDINESGDLLQPCIEAALNLGCIPRRASRSQRHNNPGCYLSSTLAKEATSASPKISDNDDKSSNLLGSPAHLLPPSLPAPTPHTSNLQFASWYSALVPPTNVNNVSSEVNSVLPDALFKKNDSFPLSSPMNSLLPCQDGGMTAPGLGRVYPLYYTDNQCKEISQLSLLDPEDPTVAALVPCILPSMGMPNFLNNNGATSSNFGDEASEIPLDSGCNLSLCLGLPSPSSLDSESAWTHEVEDVGSSSSFDGSKCSVPSSSRARGIDYGYSFPSPKDKGFDFFPTDTTDEPLESCSSKWSSEGEGNAVRGCF